MDDRPDPHSSKTVQDILLEKHPVSAEPSDFALLSGEEKETNPIVFERLTPHLIKDVARGTRGAAGPSGLDADAWQQMLVCFKKS